MKNFVLVSIAGVWLCCGACVSDARQPLSNQSDSLSRSDSAGKDFFPVAAVLESEILYVDSMPLALHKYVTRDGHTDSSFIRVPEFNALALQFLVPELHDGSFERDFTESSFIDRGSRAVTFTYSTSNRNLSLQRVDVIATPQGAIHQMKSVYLEMNRVSGDSVILQKMFWRAAKNFEVVSLIRIKGKPPVEQQLKVVWDADEDNE
jgi:hypothetical protein